MRLIGSDGEQAGVMSRDSAIELAQSESLDLVEVSPNAEPPVCRIMDWGKHKYKQNKRAHEAKKNQKIIHLKEVKFRPNTDRHDFDFKVKHVQRFLEAGDKAKVVIFFKGREIVHRTGGEKVLQRVAEAMEDFGVIEQNAKQEGRTLTMILVPKGEKKEN